MLQKKPGRISVSDIVKAYNLLVRHIDDEASAPNGNRAYGGMVRSGKGALVEGIAKNIVEIAWKNIGGAPARLSFEKRPIAVPIRKSYIEKIGDKEIKEYIEKHIDRYIYKFKTDVIDRYIYKFKTDVHVTIDKSLVMGIECKAYTENAMLKRIAVDFMFLKQAHKNAHAVLLQLESQLGGDYCNVSKSKCFGSYPTHTILSYFDINLHIVSLLEGERKVDQPIRKIFTRGCCLDQ